MTTPLASAREIANTLAEHLGLDPARMLSADLRLRAGEVPVWVIRITGGQEAIKIAQYGLVRVPPGIIKEVAE